MSEEKSFSIEFGEAIPLSNEELLGFFVDEYFNPDLYYPPAYSIENLINATYSAALHESSLQVKTMIFTSIFQSNQYLEINEFHKFIADYFLFGAGYLQVIKSKLGNVLSLKHRMAAYIRTGRKQGDFYFVNPTTKKAQLLKDIIPFHAYDPKQNISGRPSYLAALASIRLNKEATYFRIKYYINGSHAGFILSINGDLPDKLMEDIRQKFSETRGGGSFRNILLNFPQGNKDSVVLTPISEVAAKDEFFNIKRVADEDINTSHRVPPVMMGITPKNAGGFGDPAKHAAVYYKNEIFPITLMLKSLNSKIGVEAFKFSKYSFEE